MKIHKHDFKISMELTEFEGNVIVPECVKHSDDVWVWEKGQYSARAEVLKCKDVYAIKLTGDVYTSVSYARQMSFSMTNSIRLKVEWDKKPEKFMGSQYPFREMTDCWSSAFFCKGDEPLPDRIASMIWKEDKYYHMMPICQGDFKGELKGIDNGFEVVISPFTGGYNHIEGIACLISVGDDLYETVERTVEAGFEFLGQRRAMRKDKILPEMFHYLGWCSWDAFRKEVTSEGLYQKAQEFHDKNIPVKWLLIDDGWYNTEGLTMTDFYENMEKFPEGLKATVNKLKEDYDLNWIGAWQCFLGYWKGIDPDSRLARERSDIVYQTNGGRVLPAIDEGGSFKFWNEWNTYLKNCGIDFVKVDVQNSLSCYSYGEAAIGKAVKQSNIGLDGSVSMLYGGACINCTAMGHEGFYRRGNAVINRNSMDFEPLKPESMANFVCDNIYNSLYHSLFFYTDWDMMWTDSPTTKQNIVMHAVSGAPVYISDKVGETNAEVTKAFAMSDGRLLKCEAFALPFESGIFDDPRKEEVLLKAWNKIGKCFVVGVFNLNNKTEAISDNFKISDIPNIDYDKYLVYNWFTKEYRAYSAEEVISLKINRFDADLYIIAPIEKGIAVLGDVRKYVSPAIIESIENEQTLKIRVKEPAKISIYDEVLDEIKVYDTQEYCMMHRLAGK